MVAPPQQIIRDIWGNEIGLNIALEMIAELRNILAEMVARPERWGRNHHRGIGIYEYYEDELGYMMSQVNRNRQNRGL